MVNPVLFRDLNFYTFVDADTITPRSEEIERAFNLETFDRAINSEVADQEAIFTDLLMASNPKTAKNPQKYVKKEQPAQEMMDPLAQQGSDKQTMRTPAAPKSLQNSLAQSTGGALV